jgi:hypothetical protein
MDFDTEDPSPAGINEVTGVSILPSMSARLSTSS